MKAAFFDIDGTLINDFAPITFLAMAAEKGLFGQKNKKNLLRSAEQYSKNEITYQALSTIWGENISEGLQGQKQNEILKLNGEFWELIKPKVAFWAEPLISLFNKQGYRTITISGSHIELLSLYKDKFGFSDTFGTIVETKNGVYTGKLITNSVLDTDKHAIFLRFVQDNTIDTAHSFGLGDTEHDLAFLSHVGNPVAVNPTTLLEKYAREHSWPTFKFTDDVYTAIKQKLIDVDKPAV